MQVHRKGYPSIKFSGTHLCTWVERSTARVKCLAQEHNTMSPARARTRTRILTLKKLNTVLLGTPHLLSLLFGDKLDVLRTNRIQNVVSFMITVIKIYRIICLRTDILVGISMSSCGRWLSWGIELSTLNTITRTVTWAICFEWLCFRFSNFW